MQGQGLFQGQEYVGVDLASSRPGLELSQDGGNEFRNGRMYVHGTLQRSVGCLSVNDVENAVDDLVAADTEDGGPENLPCVGIDDDFDEALRLSLLDGARRTKYVFCAGSFSLRPRSTFPSRSRIIRSMETSGA